MATKDSSNTTTRSARTAQPEDDARLLEMIVCVGLSDRLEAMTIRDSDGPAAAIKFLRETTLTDESYDRGPVAIESAKAEIRRQLLQSYELVAAANALLADEHSHNEPRAMTLLDMAEDVLGDLQYINRLDPPSEDVKGGAA